MKTVRISLVATLFACCVAAADTSSWQNLASLRDGQKVDIRTTAGDSHGEFVRFDAQAVTIRDRKGEHSLAKSDVTRVSLAKRRRGIWIGAIAGAAGGLAAGAALGSRLANESGGDFNNLKPAVTAGCAVAGAAIGAAVGAAVRRETVIYRR